MASWREFEEAEPEFAARVQELFDAFRHKTIATLRKDGAPRISGIECEFADGQLKFGSMAGARKLDDLLRDRRFALHSGSPDPDKDWTGDAKVSGRALVVSEAEKSTTFAADIEDVSALSLGDPRDHLVIHHWTPERGLRSWKRY
jgi:hypothetical protein